MKKILLFIFLGPILWACGENEKANNENQVDLSNAKSKLSYIAGAEQAKMVTTSGDPNLKSLDFDEMLKGFELGLMTNTTDLDEGCRANLQNLYGQGGQDFNIKYVKQGSLCIGKIAGAIFSTDWKEKESFEHFDLEFVKIGFRDGLHEVDTLVPAAEREEIIKKFMAGVMEKVNAKKEIEKVANAKASDVMMNKAKAIPGVKILPSGIIIETIKAGKGGSPSENDDVKADYILTGPTGDTLENSIAIRAQRGGDIPAFSLNQVIQGWKQGFPNLKKGGIYRMYVPASLAYGEDKALCFYIDFMDFGAPGTLAAPRPQQGF
jgi:FKBP-type peptidyl-prolyl cis-trans isomerase